VPEWGNERLFRLVRKRDAGGRPGPDGEEAPPNGMRCPDRYSKVHYSTMWWAPRFIGLTKHSLFWQVRCQKTSGLVVRAGWWGRCLGRGAGNRNPATRAGLKAAWCSRPAVPLVDGSAGERQRRLSPTARDGCVRAEADLPAASP
jgi:hypothetical protein